MIFERLERFLVAELQIVPSLPDGWARAFGRRGVWAQAVWAQAVWAQGLLGAGRLGAGTVGRSIYVQYSFSIQIYYVLRLVRPCKAINGTL